MSTADDIKQLREQTGAGMLDCKKALAEANNDLDKAVELLRKRGAAIAAKKAGRIAAEGLLGYALSADGTRAALVEVNSETDFVARNPDFIAFSEILAKVIVDQQPADLDALRALPFPGLSVSVLERTAELTGKIGEKIDTRRFVSLKKGPGDSLVAYLHPGSKIGVLILASGATQSAEETTFLKDVAMHVAAMFPQYLHASEIPEARLQSEKEIFAEQMKAENKPPEILEKILLGKLAKFKKDVSLLDQVFVKDPDGKTSVSDWAKSRFPTLKLERFVRYQVGEGIEKKVDDFAAEVARQVAESSKN